MYNDSIWNYKILIEDKVSFLNNKITIKKYYELKEEIEYIFYWLYTYYKNFIKLIKKSQNDFIEQIKNINIIYEKYNTLIKNNSRFIIVSIFNNNKYENIIKLLTIKLAKIYLNNLSSKNFTINKYNNGLRSKLSFLYKINYFFQINQTYLKEIKKDILIIENKIFNFD
jgi:hypothetical protein